MLKRMIRGKSSHHGFSLIELMVVVTLVGVLAAVAFPAFGTWIQDTKTRTVAEAIQNGVRLAQSEAVRRGRRVQFFLTDSVPDAGVATSTSGRNWGIQSMSLTNAAAVEEFIQGATLRGDGGSVTVLATSAVITFNSIGRVILPATPTSYQITNANGSRRLNVTVSLAGGIRMCDPDKTRSSSSPDGC